MKERTNVRIHPSAEVSDLAEIGEGTSIWNNSQIRENVSIGQKCILGKDVYVDFSVKIGNNVKIQNCSNIYHGATIEDGVFIGPGVILTNDKIPRAISPNGDLKGNDDWVVGPILIKYGASVGAGSIILPGVTIGRFAMVSAGAIVTKDVPDQMLAVGTPAKNIAYICKCGLKLEKKSTSDFFCEVCNEYYKFE